MCGIAAIWNWSESEITSAQLFAMARAQMHRGPDGHGYAMWGYDDKTKWPLVWHGANTASPDAEVDLIRIGIAHNLLAIQDTSPAARQPMSFGTQRYWIAYNGEIYNFVELRDELIAEGFSFVTSSDTEVLLTLWHKLGPKALDRLRGMFAFLIYDCEDNVLWAARDRFGIKPLYYTSLPGDAGIIFASEFRGIHAASLVPRKWNQLAVKAFLVAGINKPGDTATFFEGVNELPPGCLLEVRPHSIKAQYYYQLPSIKSPTYGIEVLPELRAHFLETVDLHLRSAREVGTCMSGGLDSTTIACAIDRLLGRDATSFKAFTIGAATNDDFELARLAADRLKLLHYAVHAPESIKLADLVDMIVACETPNHVWGPINQYLLMRYIGTEHNIHVLLDGQGGDEVFSGYPWFFPVVEQFIKNVSGSDEAESLRDSHFSNAPLPLPTLNSFHQIFFSPRKWIEAHDGGASAALEVSVDEVMEWAPVNYYLNGELDWASFREREFYRRELQFLLRQEDRLGMWFSIESRVPFLDHEFVEFATMLGPHFLLSDGYLKYPLRILFPELPKKLRFNIAKRGFWEDYSEIPHFRYVARLALGYSEYLLRMVSNQEYMNELHTSTLWRFFQIAVLSEAGSKEEGRAWVNDLLKRIPPGRLTVYPWLQHVSQRVRSALRRLI